MAVLLCCLAPGAARGADRAEPVWGIFVMNRDGSQVRRVVSIEPFPRLAAPRWSHDAGRLAFQACGDQPCRALLVGVDGRNLFDLGAGARPDWSPDDKQLLYEVPTAGRTTVWVQNANGKAPSWLAAGSAPRWSPDGSRIAMAEPLRVLDVVTGEQREILTAEHPLGQVAGCDWSPDGKRLAVVAQRGDRRELLLVGADPAEPTVRVRLRGGLDGAPAFSPDGNELAVAIHDPEQEARRIHVLSVAGDERPRAIPGQRGDNCDPAWSPDGKQLAFASTRRP